MYFVYVNEIVHLDNINALLSHLIRKLKRKKINKELFAFQHVSHHMRHFSNNILIYAYAHMYILNLTVTVKKTAKRY